MCEFWVGAIGAAIGALGALGGVWLTHTLQTHRSNERDKGRKMILRRMLDNKPEGTEWRFLKTMARVIGASEDETARLLIDIGARGSETESSGWDYIKNKPLR